MPRLTTFGTTASGRPQEESISPHDRAGAASRVRMGGEYDDAERQMRAEQRYQETQVKEEARYQETLKRQSATDARAARYEDRADTREERIVKSQELDDKLKQAKFDRELAEETRAKSRALIDEDRAVKAGDALFKIDTKAKDAEQKFAEVYRDYGDLITDEKRFPRLKGQWDFNQKNFTFHRAEAAKTEPSEKLGTIHTDSEGKTSTTRPITPEILTEQERAKLLKEHNDLQATLIENPGRIPEINALKAKLGYRQLDSKGQPLPDVAPGFTPPAVTLTPGAAAPAHPMEGQIVKQKSTGKTGRIVNGQFVEQ